MARARRQSSSSSSRPAARSTSRKTRTTEVEVVEEDQGFGMEEGIIFMTTLILVVAFVLVDMARGKYGEGMFFK